MFDKKEFVGGAIGTILSATGTAIQTEDVLRIVSLIITIIGAIISMIVIPIANWYRNAKKDGKITKEEISEGVDILQEGIDKVQQIANDDKKKED